MKNYDFTACIEKDKETGLYFGYVPYLQGAHTQGATLDELHKNLQEVVSLCLEEISSEEKEELNDFVGMQKVSVNI
ncbi:MAG: type II toxin-antitoxin system HicB family antitoxin [Ekhidna sp.]|nr:type II toxin-antitoxin system HicB family antitoxin [Ekhidna sp.]